MGREVRRVPLDWDWPINKVWEGFLEPDELRLPTCEDCGGSGYSGAGAWLKTLCYRLMMLASDALYDQPRGKGMHPWLAEDRYPPTRTLYTPVSEWERESARQEIARCEADGQAAHHLNYRYVKEGSTKLAGYEVVRPSEEIVDLFAGLSGRSREQLSRGGIMGMGGEYMAARKIVDAAGLDPDDWGHCPTCGGEGSVGTPEQRKARDAWEPIEPPTGEGWQLWETVSEGSPISPVFPDAEGLIRWLTTDYNWGIDKRPMTREQAEAFVGAGHSVASFVITGDGRLIDGAAAVHELRSHDG